MARPVRQYRPCAWATACVLATAVASTPSFARPSNASGIPEAAAVAASDESSSKEIEQGLSEAHRRTKHAVEAGDLEAVHEGEAAIDEALHALEGRTRSLPGSHRERAQQLLDQCFEIVDGLHEAAEAGDASGYLEQLVRELGTLIAEMQTLFHVTSAVGAQTFVRRHHTSNRFSRKEDSQ